MPTRDEILQMLVQRVTVLESKVDALQESEDPWAKEFKVTGDHVPAPLKPAHGKNHPDDPHVDTPEVIEAKRRIAEANANDLQPVLHTFEILVDPMEDGAMVTVPSPTDEQTEHRRQWAETVLANLNGLDPDVSGPAYLEGGPIWLYAYDRDHVVGLPDSVKAEMINDVAMTAPETAHEMARDLFKVTDPDTQSAWAHDNMQTVADQRSYGGAD